jgi:hypothetical protein
MYGLTRQRNLVYFATAFFSLLLSVCISGRESVINTDAICYLQSAATLKQGVELAMSLCGQAKWPLYSVLIAGLVSITKLSYVTSAYILNGIFSLMTALIFVRTVALVGGKQAKTRLLWLAALVILLAHEFNAVKAYIIRDHGFWAFYLLSILFLLHYFRVRQWYYALGWSISIIVATLFRIEGAIFLLVIPFIVAFAGEQMFAEKIKVFLQLNALTCFIGLGLGAWFLVHPLQSAATERLQELQFQLLHSGMLVKENFQAKAATLAHLVLGGNAAHEAATILLVVMVVWYLLSILTNLSVIYTVLVVYAWWKKLLLTERAARAVLWSYILVSLGVTAVFFAENLFLSKRYLLALSLVLMVWVPFALENLFKYWHQQKWPLTCALFFIVVSSLGGIFDFGYSKQYIREAGLWLANNAPPAAVIYSNDIQVMYYSQHFGNQIFAKAKNFTDLRSVAKHKWEQYDYLALRIDPQESANVKEILHEINLAPVRIFQNKRGDQVRIYRRLL